MGVIIKSPSQNGWAIAKRIELPFEASWEGFFSFGINASVSIRNMVEGKSALSIVGSPTYGSNYIELTGAQVAYLVSGIKNSTDMTIMATALSVEEKGSVIVSNYQSTRADNTGLCIGTSLGFDVGTNTTNGLVISRFNHATLVGGVSTGAAAETSVESPINQWGLIAGRVKNSERTRAVYNLTAGTSGTNTPAVNDVDLGDFLRIGSAYNNQFPGKVRISELAIFSEKLSDSNFSSLTEFMRQRAISKGISV